MKILIKNGKVIDPKNNVDMVQDILIESDKIICVKENIEEDADEIIDATNLWVTPGFIDLHVHLRDPGFEHKETIESGSESAAMGGFTTICCMPNTKPVIDSGFVVEYIKLKAKQFGKCNVLPIGSITKSMMGEELSSIGKMYEAGICAISEDGKSVSNAGLMKKGIEVAEKYNLPVFSHCEDSTIANKGLMNEGERAKKLRLKGISNDSEDIIVARDLLLAESAGGHLHICHMSTEGSVYLLKRAKLRGGDGRVSGEATPHHFTLTDEDIHELNTNFKMSPPLRSKESKNAILQGLKDGTIDVIATDHAPHYEDDKNCDFARAANGIVGLETALCLGITELVNKNVLSPMDFIAKLTCNPAKIINLDRGHLSVGAIADIAIINPKEEYCINKNDFKTKGRNTPFNGKKVCGKVKYTILGGQVVVRGGKLC